MGREFRIQNMGNCGPTETRKLEQSNRTRAGSSVWSVSAQLYYRAIDSSRLYV